MFWLESILGALNVDKRVSLEFMPLFEMPYVSLIGTQNANMVQISFVTMITGKVTRISG